MHRSHETHISLTRHVSPTHETGVYMIFPLSRVDYFYPPLPPSSPQKKGKRKETLFLFTFKYSSFLLGVIYF